MDDLLKQTARRTNKKVPKTRYPKNIENWYAGKLNNYVRSWQVIAMAFLNERLAPYIKGGVSLSLNDAKMPEFSPNDPSWFNQLKTIVNLLTYQIEHAEPDTILSRTVTRYMKVLNHFSFMNVSKQTGIVGVNPIGHDANLSNYAQAKITDNVSLIKTMRSSYASKLQNDIYHSVTTGKSINISRIKNAITNRTYQSYAHARIIAADQTGTIISNVDAYRAKNAGAKKYVWHTMEDERVRKKHKELDGKTFSYDDPNGGDNGQLPGEPINCRCYAEPIF